MMEAYPENAFERETVISMPGHVDQRSTPCQNEFEVMQQAYEMTTNLDRSSHRQNQSYMILQDPQAKFGTGSTVMYLSSITTESSRSEPDNDPVLPCDYNISSDFFTWANMTRGKVIGTGMTGSVVLARDVTDPNKKLAVKIFEINTQANKDRNSLLYRKEITALRKLKDPYIISGTLGIQGPDRLYIVMPFFPRGDLYDKLKNITEYQTGLYFLQLCSAVSHLHTKLVVHLDIKLRNILLAHDNHIVLTDFGLSRVIPNHNCTIFIRGGTKAYWAPECFKDERVNPFKVDVHATGVVLWELVFKKHASRHRSCLSRLQAQPNVDASYRDFLETLLEPDAEKRLTMPEFMIKMDNTLKEHRKAEEGQSSSHSAVVNNLVAFGKPSGRKIFATETAWKDASKEFVVSWLTLELKDIS